MRTLVAGPFVGEFGWEVMGWQSVVRARARGHDRTIVISRPEQEYLYRDFCDRFVPWSPGSYRTVGYACQGGRPYRGEIHARFPGALAFMVTGNRAAARLLAGAPQEFIRFGADVEPAGAFDIVVHARAIPETGDAQKAARNWPADRWHALVALLARDFRVAAIGLPGLAMVPEGAVDCRHLPLDGQCALMHRARCTVGPSSGPMHLASLCGSPHVVWTARDGGHEGANVRRYASEWNPLATPVCIITRGGWRPEVETVLSAVRRLAGDDHAPPVSIVE